ncbi:tyrosine-type recombinase/integrase [Kribbella rubisoli]|uniref:tyrosine-type recombinase/integrase n=1 Tax=Kribbella rubisoli TaxID=3075929 RepID=UPI00102B2F35|nr:tyrosine-type recombinase/integrase [Kribbella rubisoli]
MKLAVRYGAITVNPAREVDTIEAKPKNPPRALATEEVTLLQKTLTTDEHATAADLPDLVTFMLGTGVRIGEALAVLWNQADLESGTVKITHTIARPPGQGLIRKTIKSRTGERTLTLPNWAAAMLRDRHTASTRPDDPVFPDTTSGYSGPPTPAAPSAPP